MTTKQKQSSSEPRHGPYQLFMLAVSLYALGALVVDSLGSLAPATRQILEYADTAVCVLFLADFAVQLATTPNRWHYFTRWGWIDLLSSIPVVDAFRIGRVTRIVRILRVLRGVRSAKLLAGFLLDRRAEATFLVAALVSLLLVVFASVAILQFERVEGSNITSAQDAIWWSFVTITTVGYGDRYPVTGEGRVIAALLMTAGVGLFGTFSGFVASWFLAPVRKERESELHDLRNEILSLRQLLETRSNDKAPERTNAALSPPDSIAAP